MEVKQCRLCGHATLRHLYTANQQQILRCTTCHFVQVADKPSQEALSVIYERSYFQHSKYRDKATLEHEFMRRLELVRRYVPAGAGHRLLEVGCASGEFIQAAKSDYQMYGFDLSDFAAEQARQRNPEIADQIWSGRLEDQLSHEMHFDAVLVWDTIEHIWDPISSARQLLDYVKPEGYVFISTPAIDTLTGRLMGRFWYFMTPPEHLSFYSRQSLKWLFEKILNTNIIENQRMGKWANVSFILYKIRRVAPFLMPEWFIRLFEKQYLGKLAIYVPVNDIQYVVIQKR